MVLLIFQIPICFTVFHISFNRLATLPRGFGAFYVLEILDLSYNNLNEKSFSNNFSELSKSLCKLSRNDTHYCFFRDQLACVIFERQQF